MSACRTSDIRTSGARFGAWWRPVALLAGAVLVSTPAAARGQSGRGGVTPMVDVGSHAENYLRYLESLGSVPSGQVSIRPWSPSEVTRRLPLDSALSANLAPARPFHRLRGGAWQFAPLALDVSFNSSFPFGINDGPVWRGRGITAAVQGGVVLQSGILTVALRPTAYWAQNQSFAVMETGYIGALRYADPLNATLIDRPQRFGDGSVARLSAGESTVRIDLAGLAVGIASGNQWWGPMGDFPYLLGNNAEGMPRLFFGTSRPLPLGIGWGHAHVFYADLAQSAYTDIEAPLDRRFASGVIATFSPRGLPGFEIGAARFFHQAWPADGPGAANFRKPLEEFLKRNVKGDPGSVDRTNADNQLASLFARWVFPRSGLEIYGEFGREDHSFDERDVLLSPDHQSTLGLGLRRAWRAASGDVVGVRAEFIDLDPSNLGRIRFQGGKYLHDGTRQGHTVRGQLLGSGFSSDNGAGSILAWERFSRDGARAQLSLARMVVRETKPGTTPALDVQYALSGERTRRRGGHSMSYGLSAVYELDRYFGHDAGNVLATMRMAW